MDGFTKCVIKVLAKKPHLTLTMSLVETLGDFEKTVETSQHPMYVNLRRFVSETRATFNMKFKYEDQPIQRIQALISAIAKKGLNINWFEILPSYRNQENEHFDLQFVPSYSKRFATRIVEENDFSQHPVFYTALELDVIRNLKRELGWNIVVKVDMRNEPGRLSEFLQMVRDFKLDDGREASDFLFSQLNIGADNVLVLEPRLSKFKPDE